MDFGATQDYIEAGYGFAAEILDARQKRRRMPELAPMPAPVYH
jgi:hypothetical protein